MPEKKEELKKYWPFKDGNNTNVPIQWWARWTFAAWCWRRWLRYEGMPKELKTVDEMHKWNRELIEMQDKSKP